jgi:hypothetical protein
MPGAGHLPKLRDLLRSRGRSQAIQINGQPHMVTYRFPFPNEKAWSVFLQKTRSDPDR